MTPIDIATQREQLDRIVVPLTLVVCAAAGVLAALSYGIAAAIALGMLLFAVAYKVVGAPGIVLLLPVVYCFAGLNRIDDVLSIPIDERFRIPVAYWLTALSLFLLAFAVPWGRYAREGHALPQQRFARRFLAVLLSFAGLCLFSLLLNHLGDPYVEGRNVTAELRDTLAGRVSVRERLISLGEGRLSGIRTW
ncbi:MAG: hypothetical protein NTZ09_20375 [Candidatus Hydrogenedentes bacterium]|nr:hypothetical protein [Candidatus Hydrogenedentota bacterium]